LIINSFTTTPSEILAEFERQTASVWEVSYTSLERLRMLEQKAWEESGPNATGYTLRRIWTEGGTLYPANDNESVGFTRQETLSAAVSRVIAAQT
jgi:hypothetical protein